MEQLYHKEELISSMRGERSKLDRDGSSRMANLNQALMQAKQACAQLTDDNNALKRRESELLDTNKTLEQRCEALAASRDAESKSSRERQQYKATPVKTPVRPHAMPPKPIPGESEVDTLHIENAKLKQEFQCLQTNFQLTSTKSTQLKKDMKDLEKSLEELQDAYDQVLGEKENLKKKYDEARMTLANKSGSGALDREKCARMEEELSAVRSQSDVLQRQYFDLQDKLKSELARSLESQVTIEGLDAQIKAFQVEKLGSDAELSSAQEKVQELADQLSSYQHSEHYQTEIQRQSSEAIVAYERKVSLLKSEKEDIQEQLAQASDSLDELQSRLCSLEKTSKALQAKTTGLETQNQLLTTQLHEQSGSQTEAALQEQLVKLSEEHQILSIRNKELEETKKRLDLHDQEQSKVNSRLQREVNHHWELAKKLQKELENLETSSFRTEAGLKEKDQQCAKARQEAEDLRLELETVANAKQMYEIEVGRMMSKLEELEQCNFELSTRLADFESVTTSVKASQSEASAKVEDLEGKLGAVRTTLVETELQVMDLRNTNELMEKENGTLLSQVNSLTEMVAARNTRIEALQSQLVRYESDSADIAARISDIENSHSHCAGIKQELEWEVETLKDSLEASATTRKESESLLTSMKSELSQLQDYNNSLESINSDLQEKIKEEMAKGEELVSQGYDTEQSRQELAWEAKAKASSLKSALEEVDFIKRASEEAQEALRGEVESLETRYSEVRDACGELRREKLEMSSQITQTRTEVRELQHINSNWKSENESLMLRVDQSREEVTAMKEELLATQHELKQSKVELKHQKQQISAMDREGSATKQELARIAEQYEKLKESMLSLLEHSGEATGSAGAAMTTPTKKRLKGILKNSVSGPGPAVLKPVENVNKEN